MLRLHKVDIASVVPDLHICNRIRCTAIALVWTFLTPFIAEIALPVRSGCDIL